MEIKINILEKDRPRVPLKVGQVRLNKKKDEIILVTKDINQTFGFTFLKGDMDDWIATTHDSITDKGPSKNWVYNFYEEHYPIVADSASLMINIK